MFENLPVEINDLIYKKLHESCVRDLNEEFGGRVHAHKYYQLLSQSSCCVGADTDYCQCEDHFCDYPDDGDVANSEFDPTGGLFMYWLRKERPCRVRRKKGCLSGLFVDSDDDDDSDEG